MSTGKRLSPDLIAQWAPDNNRAVAPVPTEVWWRCASGHVYSMTDSSDCPVCRASRRVAALPDNEQPDSRRQRP